MNKTNCNPNSLRKNNFPASIQNLKNQSGNNPFRNNMNDQSEIDVFFTFNPIKPLKFLEDKSGINSNLKNDSMIKSFENFGKIRSKLIESTTIEDSVKKNSNKACKTEKYSDCNSIYFSKHPAKLQNQLENSLFNQNHLENNRQVINISSEIHHAKRTRSLNFNNLEIGSKDFNCNAQKEINERIGLIKSQNVGKTKVLNVDLSKNYIMAYKKIQNDEMEQIEKSKKILTLKMGMPKHEIQITSEEKNDLFYQNLKIIAKKEEEEELLTKEAIKNAMFLKSATNRFRTSSQKSSHLKKFMPKTLDNFFSSKFEQTDTKRLKSKPKVFDFCKYLESDSSLKQKTSIVDRKSYITQS